MASQFVEKLVAICKAEHATFGNGALKEFDEAVFRRVGDYWTELAKTPPYASWAGYNGRSGVTFKANGQVAQNKNQPWSAAFISFAMKMAGAGSHFSYAPSHSVYIVKALNEAKKANPSGKFIARRHKQYTPKLGDLIACERQPSVDPNFDTYKDYVAAGRYEAHCDIVVEVGDRAVKTIGGNVSNSVSLKTWPLDATKTIANHDPNNPAGAVICVIETLL